ncbi:family 16 glycosylhydrolase [Marivita sp. GX14005]|uniref:family 16 glycosylhydrolase n=1 Tax=Marivita sp. GX14005 TaxID=2942276 RepID=UPI002019E772|nr:family 16 glycosylhydrolase [Marivita sp. GX14005]MCL3881734.1 family 16 glycosylhydrolase [Marivita sp. GX14005]
MSGAALAVGIFATPPDASAKEKAEGVPFRTVFALSGLGDQWWIADYDHPAGWFGTAWRKSAFETGDAGALFALSPVPEDARVSRADMKEDNGSLKEAGKTSKDFFSAQLQRRKWYGHGRYEIVMRPAKGEGLISAFYLYTGPHFGDEHDEIDIEFLGKDTTKVQINRYDDGEPLAQPPWIDLGFDASDAPMLYAIEWSEESIVWTAGEAEIFRLTGKENLPQPPMKIYVDLWAGGPQQAGWSGEAPPHSRAQASVQCVSYTPPDKNTPQCSDLMHTN